MLADPDFLTPVNPKVRLQMPQITRNTGKPALLFDFRATLMDHPPLAKNERMPAFLALSYDEPAISFSNRQDFVHIPALNLYIPARHRLISDLAELELAHPSISTAHGTLEAVRKNCSGPICRRLSRESRAEAAFLRRARKSQSPKNHSTRQRNAAPQYRAVEPLLIAYTILSHYLSPAPNPSKLSKTLKQANLHTYLLEQYPDLVTE